MLLFLLFYLGIYGGAHAYLSWRTVRAFQLGSPYPVVFTFLSLAMILAPILVRVLERYGMESPARAAAWIGYLWMGFFFLLLSASIALDLLRGLTSIAGWLLHSDIPFTEARLLTASIVIALAASLYGLFEARHIKVERVTLQSPKIPASVGRVRIVQISDVHLGLMVGRNEMGRIVKEVTAAKPDVILCTGDLVDGQMDGLRGLHGGLSALQAPLGKFAVLGNHEGLAGVVPSEAFIEKSGFQLLREQRVVLSDYLTLAGVDDPWMAKDKSGVTEASLLATLPRESYTVLLKHRPNVAEKSLGLFDLQLSGHVHKGQIFPFNLVTRLFYPAKIGLSEVGSGSLLYVSRGTGTWGPPMRVLAPPEVTIIDLVSSSR